MLVRGSTHHSYIVTTTAVVTTRPRRNLAMTCVTPPARDYIILFYYTRVRTHMHNICIVILYASGFGEESLKANSLRNAIYYIIICIVYLRNFALIHCHLPSCTWFCPLCTQMFNTINITLYFLNQIAKY